MKTSFYSRAAAASLALALGAATLSLSSGCLAVAAGAGAGAVAYVRGDLTATLDAGVEQTNSAVSRAIDQLQFAKVSERKDALQGEFIARNAADKKIKIEVERKGERLTEVTIRIGVFGDENLSLAILDRIKANL